MSSPISSEIRLIELRKLIVGQPLPGDIIDIFGRTLIRAGQVLTEKRVRRLAQLQGGSEYVYVGPGWPDGDKADAAPGAAPPAAPERPIHRRTRAIIEHLGLQRNQIVEDGKRRYLRHPWQVQMSLQLREVFSSDYRERTVDVTTQDISINGFGFLYDQFINPGTTVVACFKSLPDEPLVRGVVRGCIHLKGKTHRVGVEFEDPSQD